MNVPDIFWLNLVLFIAGLVIIVKGSDLFLDAAVWVAKVSGIPQIIIGATIVSLCTTLPELVSSTTAVLKDSPDMALGNAIGSVICNTGFILAVMLFFVRARVVRPVFLTKGVFLLGLLGLALYAGYPFGGETSLIERGWGFLFLGIMAVFFIVNYFESIKYNTSSADAELADGEGPVTGTRAEYVRHLSWFTVGAVMVAAGAWLLVTYGKRLAQDFGVSEAVISLVFVAFGTSLPELFTAITAIRKKAHDISLGNIFGANVMNVGLVTGLCAALKPLGVKDELLPKFDIPFSILICGFVFAIGMIRGKAGRKTAVCLFVFYIGWLAAMFGLGRI